MAVNFDPVRRWLLNEGRGNEAVASALEAAFQAAMASSTATGGTTDLTAILARLDAAEAAVAAAQAAADAAQIAADDASLLVPTYNLNPAEVLAITDTHLLSEAGDAIFTEDNDFILIEA